MTPQVKIRKPVAIRSALPPGVIRKGAKMPPHFNLLLVISSYSFQLPQFFVQFAYGKRRHIWFAITSLDVASNRLHYW